MDLKLFVDSSNTIHQKEEMVKSIINQVACLSGLEPKHIKTFSIASNERYGEAISNVNPEAKYTESEYLQGVGKTITTHKNGKPEHNIVLHLLMFELILNELHCIAIKKNYPGEMHFGFYMLSHEIGHCKFNEIYYQIDPAFEMSEESAIDIESYNEQQLSVMLGEIGACYFGERFKTKELYEFCWQQDYDTISKMKSMLDKAKNENSIINVAQRANSISWIYLIQYSKLTIGRFETSFESMLIKQLLSFDSLSKIHSLIDDAINSFVYSSFKNYKEFKTSIELARQEILKLLKVKISFNKNELSCFWN